MEDDPHLQRSRNDHEGILSGKNPALSQSGQVPHFTGFGIGEIEGCAGEMNFAVRINSLPHVIRSAALALWGEVTFLDQLLDSQFYGAGFAAGEAYDLAEGEGFVMGEKGEVVWKTVPTSRPSASKAAT